MAYVQSMDRLLPQSEISSTCWIEFNIGGTPDYYVRWLDTSHYASLENMDRVYKVFSLCIQGFSLYGPLFLEQEKLTQLCSMLDGFASTTASVPARKFAQELEAFLRRCNERADPVWMLGV